MNGSALYVFSGLVGASREASHFKDYSDTTLAGMPGCDDALVGIGRVGRLRLDFTREVTSAEAALVSAVLDVRSAMPPVKLIEATWAARC